MRIKDTDLTFDKRDEFTREPVAEKVINLLTSDIDVSPMVIDGNWGTGKTEFCHKLINKFRLDHDKFTLLYIDAFRADHADNPLMTVLSAVLSKIKNNKNKAKLYENSIKILKFSLSTGMKAAVSHVLRQNADDITGDLEDHLENAANEAIDASIKSLLKEHEEAQQNLVALQGVLEEIARDSPIVIFIDELDRCRPDFAVQILEVIKHTFNIENVQFVLITNTQQLKASINHCYGQHVDSKRYLDKFLKFSFQLPEFIPENHTYSIKHSLASKKHLTNLISQSTDLRNSDIGLPAQDFTKNLIGINNRSLREVETFVRHLEIYVSINKNNHSSSCLGDKLLIITGAYLFCFYPELIEPLKKHGLKIIKTKNIFDQKDWSNHQENETNLSDIDILALLLTNENISNNLDPKISKEFKSKFDTKKGELFYTRDLEEDDLLGPILETIACLQLGIS